MTTKQDIRREIIEKLKTEDPQNKSDKDSTIKNKVLALPEYKAAKIVATYVSMEDEVDTKALIDEALKTGKRVVVPVIAGKDLELSEIKSRKADLAEGPYGILQPDKKTASFKKENLDLIIVPGRAFGLDGSRLGRGKGYYDRFLKGLPGSIKKIGLAYDIQIKNDLPVTPRDIPVDIVITN